MVAHTLSTGILPSLSPTSKRPPSPSLSLPPTSPGPPTAFNPIPSSPPHFPPPPPLPTPHFPAPHPPHGVSCGRW